MIRFPPRKILVGYDRSALSKAAWHHAAALARRCGAALEIAYIEPSQTMVGGPGGGFYPLPGLTPAQALAVRKELRALVGEGPKVTVTSGDAAARLRQLALAHHADMIVVGTHGRRGLSRVLLGSVAEALIRVSPVPVLVARGRATDLRAVLAPVNFTSYSEHGFAYAAALADGVGANLTALHINVDPIWGGNPLMRLRRLIEALPAGLRAGCKPFVLIDEIPARGIRKASAKHDLIVMVAHKRSAVEDVFFGMTAEKILRTSRKSLLVVPPPKPRSNAVVSLRGDATNVQYRA